MKKTVKLAHENIKNLKSLWRIVGKKAQSHTVENDFEYGAVAYSEWPNRLWFNQSIDDRILKKATDVLHSIPYKIVVPYWGVEQQDGDELLEGNGFKLQFEQVGMSLEMKQPYEVNGDLYLEEVKSEKEAVLWERLFAQAFGYTISHRLLLQSYDNITWLIAFSGDTPVGTVILHYTQDIVGVHAMGIIPEMRKQGFAEQMMRIILNQSIKQGYRYSTLQASAMGKGLYLKLGYQEEFMMKNYTLPKE